MAAFIIELIDYIMDEDADTAISIINTIIFILLSFRFVSKQIIKI